MRIRLATALALVIVAASSLVACQGSVTDPSPIGPTAATSSASPQASGEPQDAMDAFFDGLIERANAEDPGGPQELVLRRAKDTGAVTFEQMQELKEYTFACFDEVGIIYKDDTPYEEPPGFKRVYFSFFTESGEGADARLAVGDACQNKFFVIADEAYQSSPTALDAADAAREADRAVRIACLEERGLAVKEDISLDELDEMLFEEAIIQDRAGSGLIPCAAERAP